MAQVIPPLTRICNKTLNSAGKNSTFQTGLKAEEPSKRSKVASSQNIHYQLWLYLTHILHTKNKSFSIYTQECWWGFLPKEKKIGALFLQLTTTQLLLTDKEQWHQKPSQPFLRSQY